ncbi:LytR/AlgR family response regulator transcription factor [Spongiivirga citrea]|uniref:HTH LytTR-type domain-containing protein n=1 Tax=Spongiivirga citrea TaxID=1481457 RepID=A0A6M0CNR4_9FLAO|nr:LytTR family DNA-binding domain-containing protein [Spongiivirga citrea]NER17117.1 hypothetical protein [Spongiivirga citrea]
MISLNKTVAYTKSWPKVLLTSFIIGGGLSAALILLEPFDTSEATMSYKELRLAGYTFCIVIPASIFHLAGNAVYKKQKNRWFIVNEVTYMVLCLFTVISSCFLYNVYVVNNSTATTSGWIYFMKYYGLPFIPLLGPPWMYLRSKFGEIIVPTANEGKSSEVVITISGENKSESISLNFSDFVFAQAQQNYVAINYIAEGELKQEMIRSTLANLTKQIPDAWQVHRSYLVNLDFLKSVEGNARKRSMTLTTPAEPIPISQKYYEALKNRLSKSSQNLQK